MGKIISVSMQKGGTGKTTTAINLGAAFAERENRVLLWDLDPQGGATVGLGFDPDELKLTVYSVLSGEADPNNIILKTEVPNLDLAPANWNLLGLEMEVTQFAQTHPPDENGLTWEPALKEILTEVTPAYDFIIIDNPPHPGPLTILALVAAQQVVIPVQCELLALRALKQLYKLIADVQQVNSDLDIKVLRTLFDRRKKHHQEIFEEIAAAAPEHILDTYIKQAVVLTDASGAKCSVLQFAPQSYSAGSYRQLTHELLHHNGKPEGRA